MTLSPSLAIHASRIRKTREAFRRYALVPGLNLIDALLHDGLLGRDRGKFTLARARVRRAGKGCAAQSTLHGLEGCLKHDLLRCSVSAGHLRGTRLSSDLKLLKLRLKSRQLRTTILISVCLEVV